MRIEPSKLYVPMRDGALNSLRSFFENPELVKELFSLIQKSKQAPISQAILESEYPKLKLAEEDFNMYIKGMYWETEQLFNLSSPILHPAIREHLRTDLTDLENECKKKTLYNYFLNGLKLTKSRKRSLDTKLSDKSPEFEHYVKYIEFLLDKFKYELSFFFPANNITPITFTRSIDDSDRSSVFIEYSLKDAVIQRELFIANCNKFNGSIENSTGKNIRLLSCQEKGRKYIWSESLPFLGLFLRALWEGNIIRGIPKEKIVKVMMNYFNLPEDRITTDNINYTARFLSKDLIGKDEQKYLFLKKELVTPKI